MDDFLGTSIQYSEQQILLLEKQHEADLEQTVEDLIASGFLDSDYEESTESESAYTDTRGLNDDDEENTAFESDSVSEIIDDSKMIISSGTPSLNLNLSSDIEEESNDNLAVVLYSHDGDICDCYPLTTDTPSPYDSECRFISTFGHLMDIIITDIKSLIIFFMLMMALPHIMDRDQESSVYIHRQNVPNLQQTSIFWFYQTKPNHAMITLDPSHCNDDDERDEYDPTKLHIDVMTTSINPSMKRIFSSRISHEFNLHIKPSDLLCDERYISKEIPRLFLHFGSPQMAFGAGIHGFKSPQIAKIFRDTVSHSVGRHFVHTHHLTALVMSFFGIVAFAASNSNMDEYLAITK